MHDCAHYFLLLKIYQHFKRMDLPNFKPANPDSKIKILIFTHLSNISKASPQTCWLSMDFLKLFLGWTHAFWSHLYGWKMKDIYFDDGSSKDAISTTEPVSMVFRNSMRIFTSATNTSSTESHWTRMEVRYIAEHVLLRTTCIHIKVAGLCDFPRFTC